MDRFYQSLTITSSSHCGALNLISHAPDQKLQDPRTDKHLYSKGEETLPELHDAKEFTVSGSAQTIQDQRRRCLEALVETPPRGPSGRQQEPTIWLVIGRTWHGCKPRQSPPEITFGFIKRYKSFSCETISQHLHPDTPPKLRRANAPV